MEIQDANVCFSAQVVWNLALYSWQKKYIPKEMEHHQTEQVEAREAQQSDILKETTKSSYDCLVWFISGIISMYLTPEATKCAHQL